MNRADLVLPKVHYMAQGVPAVIAGYEMAGTVIGMGDECKGFSVGDRVMSLARASFAEQCVVDHRLALHMPPSMEVTTAAAIPSWYITAHNALIDQGRMRPEDVVLIQGITTGVGIATAQIARALGANQIIGVSRSAEKHARLREFWLDALLTSSEGWPDRVKAKTNGRGADLIIDMVGGGALAGNLEAAALKGRIIAIGRLGGERDMLDINMLALKRLTIRGVTFRSRSIEEQADIVNAFAREILPLIAGGRIKPAIDCIVPLSKATEAQEHVRRNAHFGKAVLTIAG